jgi:hypothetical protein
MAEVNSVCKDKQQSKQATKPIHETQVESKPIRNMNMKPPKPPSYFYPLGQSLFFAPV